MEVTRAELKTQAKNDLKGNWGWALIVELLTSLIMYLVPYIVILLFFGFTAFNDFIVFASDSGSVVMTPKYALMTLVLMIVGLFTSVFNTSKVIAMQRLAEGRKDDIPAAIVSAFTKGRFGSMFWSGIVQGIFLALWTCLLIIPGIIKHYSYAMTYYIIEDAKERGEEIQVTDAINQSRALMDGHKMDLFILDLSFIGWHILCWCTFGIGYLWLVPYIQTTTAKFYLSLLDQQK